MPRVFLSVEQGTGAITLITPTAGLGMSRREACVLLRELAWAIETSSREERRAQGEEQACLRKLKQTYGGIP